MSVQTTAPSYAEGLKNLRTDLTNALPANALAIFDEDAKKLELDHPSVLKVTKGDKAPDFSLQNAIGEIVKLSDLLANHKIVLTFYRGSWCPYCNLQLNTYQKALSEIGKHGGELVAISPQAPDESLNMKEKNELKFQVLSDVGNSVARRYTTVYKAEDKPLQVMKDLGIDFFSHYSDDSGELPVPAVFIIQQNGIVSFAKAAGGDYRHRVEAQEIIEALKRQNS